MTRHCKIGYFDPSNDVIHFHILTDSQQADDTSEKD
jgi:hypothetical protein